MKTTRPSGGRGGVPRCAEIRDCLDLINEAVNDPPSSRRFSGLLQRLQQLLEARFAAECELYDELITRAPWNSPLKSQLEASQQNVRQAYLRWGRSRQPEQSNLQRRVHALQDAIVAHELEEEQLRHEVLPYSTGMGQTIDIPGE